MIMTSIELRPDNVQVICERCVREAKVHHVSRPLGLSRFIRVECHGVHRLVALSHYVQRIAELSNADRVAVLWSQLGDAFPDHMLRDKLAEYIAAAEYARRTLPEVETVDSDPAEWRDCIRNLESIVESIRIVMWSRAGEATEVVTVDGEMFGDVGGATKRIGWGESVLARAYGPLRILADLQDEP
jgi:hypothetical protein